MLFRSHRVDTGKKYVPILGSVKLMKELGAVIDYETAEAVFKKLDPNTVVQLEEASNGHLLYDLVKDLYDQKGTRPLSSTEELGKLCQKGKSTSRSSCDDNSKICQKGSSSSCEQSSHFGSPDEASLPDETVEPEGATDAAVG